LPDTNNKLAVVGLGCILPDANSPSEFWANTLRGHSALRRLRPKYYDWTPYQRESESARELFKEPLGAQLDDHAFDWRKFKISPIDAQGINPMHLHVLEAGAQAIEDLRYLPHASTGVFIGGTGLGWRRDIGLRIRLGDFTEAAERALADSALPPRVQQAVLARVRESLDAKLGPVSDDAVVNSLASIAAGRLALRLDLRGPHAGIDAGFASGLAAITVASRLLIDGTLDLAIAGAASECISPLELLAFRGLSVLSPGQVRPFDVAANGTQLGEGVVLFAIKRLADALDHGERVYAVLCGTGAASDGRTGSLLAPSVEGESLSMRRAYADAQIDPGTIGYVECHATGTPIGDATEVRALGQVFGSVAPGVAIGSAKPFVGHLRGASGAVGFLRAVLALHHRTIPAQIGFERAHPELDLDSSPFFVPTRQHELLARDGASNARAAVNSFGLGGNDYHVVLESFDPTGVHRRPSVTRSGLAGESRNGPVAIIGLGAVLPNAQDVPTFWRLLLDGVDTTREIPDSRFEVGRYFDSDQKRLEASYTRIGCFVEPLPEADQEFRVPPSARPQMDPGQVIAFRAAQQAVADASLETSNWDRDRTAVIFGFIPCQGRRLLAEARLNFREFEHELEQCLRSQGIPSEDTARILEDTEQFGLAGLPPITEDTLPGYLGSINAARIAKHYDLRGPHFAVESACASSLAALHAGARLLRQGVVDTVLVGGVWADGQPEFFVGNCRFGALSASAITPFDERASGFIPGEGAAVLVLRRLCDAERDGQRIHAVVRSIEGTSDGAAGRSIYSPSVEGESSAARQALEAAGVNPGDVDYVECHGTGTALGDVVEVEACTHAYGPVRERPLLIGSVKSNIGHLMAGAGAAALLKAALSLREGTIPASLKVNRLNPKIDFGAGPIEVVTKLRNWVAPAGRPRRAGVSGFGLGGTNFHAVLEEYRATGQHLSSSDGLPARETQGRVLPILVALGEDLASCARTMRSIAVKCQRVPPESYSAIVLDTQRCATESFPCRLAIVATTPEILDQRLGALESALGKGYDASLLRTKGVFFARSTPGLRVAAMFPGQGSQYPNMLREAAAAFPELGRSLDRIDREYEKLCGRKLTSSYWTQDTDRYLQSDEDIHCAVFGVNVALFELLSTYGVRVDAVMGQSAGELAALVAAGTLSLEHGLWAIRERTLAVLDLKGPDPGSMVSLACGAELASKLIRDVPGYAALAADNGPSACIVSGARRAIDTLLSRAAAEGIKATVLPVSHGYHSELIAAARPRYRKVLDSIRFVHPRVDFYSTITGTRIDGSPLAEYPVLLERQFVEPVHLRQAVSALHRDGVRLFVECGPKWPLATFVSEILANQSHIAQATVHPKVGEVEQLHRALACLFVHRVCSLSPVREMSMSPLNANVSETPARLADTAEGQTEARRVTALIETLRAVRDLIDDALTRHDTSAPPEPIPRPTFAADQAAPSAPERTGSRADSAQNCSAVLDSDLAVGRAAPTPPERAWPRADSAPDCSAVLDSDLAVGRTESESVRKGVERLLIAELVKRTGYPEDMLEPELDLEAELGIDTVKQVAALAAVREQYGLPPDPTFRMQDARTLKQAVAYLVSRVETSQRGVGPKHQAVAQPTTGRASDSEDHAGAGALRTSDTRPAERPGPVFETILPTMGRQPIEDATTPRLEAPTRLATHDSVRRLLLSELMNRTGYPEEMLELDLDLEAELGIDTVKQVAALAAVREKFGLPQDPRFRMQDARTLRQAIDYLVSRIERSDSAIPPAAPAPSAQPPVEERSPEMRESSNVAETSTRTALPQVAAVPSMSEFATALNELREYVKSLALLVTQGLRHGHAAHETAAPPADTDSESLSREHQPTRLRSVYPELLLESLFPQAGRPEAGEAVELSNIAVADVHSEMPDDPNLAGVTPLHARDAEARVVARSRRVRVERPGSPVPSHMLESIREGRVAASDELLKDYFAKSGRADRSSVEWAHPQGFTSAVGGARAPGGSNESRGMLILLGSCFDVASFAWYRLTGALHSLSGIARIRFYRVPAPGEEMLLYVRMAQPSGGFWKADVAVFDSSGALFAELSGMEGTPLGIQGTAGSGLLGPAERAWRRFARRMGRDSGIPEDIAS